jgi:hypothetical protein
MGETTIEVDVIPDVDEPRLRLARIANSHVPDRSGAACGECQWLWPCPTRRMADGTTPLDEVWYGSDDQ